ncbi:MAG: IS1 family transposase, partial [Gammaproteobacteria bacterium]|nr:IS1 family transposase [Gammaproteobacteria bacterium]
RVVKNGFHRQKQQYKCRSCGHQFITKSTSSFSTLAAYKRYSQGKQTLSELSHQMNIPVRTLWRLFDNLHITPLFAYATTAPINLIIDATFFGRYDGIMVFRANRQNLYWRFIDAETVEEVATGLDWLEAQGFKFGSITVDGKRGIISYLARRYPNVPIQFCQFHQAQIIRRYLTLNPRTPCGKYLKAVMRCLTDVDQT